MDRVGAIKEGIRLDDRRRASLTAPVLPLRRPLLVRLVLLAALSLVLLLSVFGFAHADTIPACKQATYTQTVSPYTLNFSGCEADAGTYYCSFWMTSFPSWGTCTATVDTVNHWVANVWNGVPNGHFAYSLTGAYLCPSGYTLNGTNCDSAAPPPTTCPSGYVLQDGVCVSSGVSPLTLQQAAALDWVIANQPALQSAVNQSTEVFDSALGGAFWAFGFVGVMILYFSSHVIGLVLKKVRHG